MSYRWKYLRFEIRKKLYSNSRYSIDTKFPLKFIRLHFIRTLLLYLFSNWEILEKSLIHNFLLMFRKDSIHVFQKNYLLIVSIILPCINIPVIPVISIIPIIPIIQTKCCQCQAVVVFTQSSVQPILSPIILAARRSPTRVEYIHILI